MFLNNCSLAGSGEVDVDAVDSTHYDWGAEATETAGDHVGEEEQETDVRGSCPHHSNWRCLCPRAHWHTNEQRSDATGSPVWIQCAADGAVALLRHAYELSDASECSCTFAGFQSLFGGKKLTAYDDLGDALIVFDWGCRPTAAYLFLEGSLRRACARRRSLLRPSSSL